MRTFFILLISLSTFFVSGQSARKLNKQLQQEFKKLILDYNTKFDRFDSILQLGTNESELFRESASIAYQTQNKLKECQHEALNKYDKLKDLEAIKDIDFSIDSIANYKVHNLQFKEFSESTEKYRVTRLERKKYVSNLESKNLKDQNEEYMLLITEFKK